MLETESPSHEHASEQEQVGLFIELTDQNDKSMSQEEFNNAIEESKQQDEANYKEAVDEAEIAFGESQKPNHEMLSPVRDQGLESGKRSIKKKIPNFLDGVLKFLFDRKAKVPELSASNESVLEEIERFVEKYYGMEIDGTKDFIERTKTAIDLLSQTPEFDLVKRYIKIIKMAGSSGMFAYNEKPTFEVGETHLSSPSWYASAIAHDAYHSYLYNTAKENGPVADNVWTGKAAEIKCLEFQYRAMESMKVCDPEDMEYVKDLIKEPGNYFEVENRDW